MLYRVSQFLVAFVAVVLIFLAPLSHAAALTSKELSPSGGIGNTRANFSREWGPLREVGNASIFSRQQIANYDTPDYNIQLSVLYLLENDEKPRDTDRVIWFMVSLMDPVSYYPARSFIEDYLPRDASLHRTQTNQFKETQEVYTSKSALTMFPSLLIDDETVKGTGEIWVTYGDMGLGGANIVGIEICLYDDYGR